jgi:hypothetical protein
MQARISRPLSILSFAAALAIGTIAASAETASPAPGQSPADAGTQMDGHMHAGGMGMGSPGEGKMEMHGDMKEMMSKMHDMMDMMASHVDDRIAALKTELKITDAQQPQWNSFADALRSAAKSMENMQHHMMQSKAPESAPAKASGENSYPGWESVKKSAAPPSESVGGGLLARLEMHEKMAAEHLTNLQAIKAALDPLYASFNDEQKKVADGLKVGPMGVM